MHQGLVATEHRMTEYECRERWSQDRAQADHAMIITDLSRKDVPPS